MPDDCSARRRSFFSHRQEAGGQIRLTAITGEQWRGGFSSFVVDLNSPWLVSVHLACPSWAPVLHSISEDPLLHLCLTFTSLCVPFPFQEMANIQQPSKDGPFIIVSRFIFLSASRSVSLPSQIFRRQTVIKNRYFEWLLQHLGEHSSQLATFCESNDRWLCWKLWRRTSIECDWQSYFEKSVICYISILKISPVDPFNQYESSLFCIRWYITDSMTTPDWPITFSWPWGTDSDWLFIMKHKPPWNWRKHR